MIDVKDYLLTYTRISDGEKFKAKRIGVSHIAILENGEVKIFSIYKCNQLYKGSKENRKSKNKPSSSRIILRTKYQAQAFKKYLDESDEKICTNF